MNLNKKHTKALAKQQQTLPHKARERCFSIRVSLLSIFFTRKAKSLSCNNRTQINTIVLFIVCCVYSIITPTSYAKQTRDVTGNDELLLEISKTDLTRLSVENDKIQSLQFKNGILDVTTDKKLGEAYIKPRVKHSINLFVTTKKGFVYKLLLQPIDIPSEQIILRNKNTFISEGIAKGISNDYERRLTDIIISIQQNKTTAGCFVSNLKNKKVKSPVKNIKLYAIEKYSCKGYTGYKIAIRRKKSDDKITLQEKDFITPITRAVKIYNNYLIIINKENE